MGSPKKLLVMLPRVPYPLEKGDKLRAYHQLRELSKTFEIHLWALADTRPHPDAMAALKPFCQTIQFASLPLLSIYFNILKAWFKKLPLQVGYFYNCGIAKEFRKYAESIQADHLYCQLARTAEYAREINCPKTLDFQDAFSAGVMRRKKHAAFYLKPVLAMEFRRMLRYEERLLERFDNHTIISATDREQIPNPSNKKIHIVPNGVDTEYFKPQGFSADTDLVFTGNMGYPPNVDAAVFLVKEIMPIVWQSKPTTTLLLAGASPHPDVRALAGENVRVSGWMDDIRDAYAYSRIFVAPMRIGSGMQNKLLEAMAMQLPAVTTPLANRPIGSKAGKNVLVGESAAQLASQILVLLNDTTKAKEIALSARQFVTSNYSWEGATAILKEIIDRGRDED